MLEPKYLAEIRRRVSPYFECTKFTDERKLYIDLVHRNISNIIRYGNLMSSNTIYTSCRFIRIVNKRIRHLD